MVHAFENVAWSSLFILAPLGCVYYPLSILPEWLQILAKCLPLVYIFEEARSILVNNIVNYKNIMIALTLNLFYFVGAIIVFYLAFYGATNKRNFSKYGRIIWCARKESNPEPPDPKSGALSS